MKKVYLVTGPPGAGKSRFVSQHAGSNDVCFDLDRIHESMSTAPGIHRDRKCLLGVSIPMREAFYKAVAARSGTWDNAWIITGAAKRSEIAGLLQTLRAEEVEILPSKDDCIRNILNDPQRGDKPSQVSLVNEWFSARAAESINPKSARDSFAEWFEANT